MGRTFSNYEKPDWFDLEKYETVTELNSEGWVFQLRQRETCFILERLDNDFHLEKDDSRRHDFINSLLEHGVLQVPEDFISSEIYRINWDDKLKKYNDYRELYREFMHPLTCGDAYYYGKSLLFDESYEQWIAEDDFANSDYGLVPIDLYMHRELGFWGDGLATLVIDLGAPDNKLFEDFKEWVKAAREAYDYKEGGSIRESILKRLCDTKVLPYLDLMIWSNENGVKIPNHVLGEWLFPDDPADVAEKVRKVTKPLAMRATKANFLQALSGITEYK